VIIPISSIKQIFVFIFLVLFDFFILVVTAIGDYDTSAYHRFFVKELISIPYLSHYSLKVKSFFLYKCKVKSGLSKLKGSKI